MPADVLAQADERAVVVEEPGGMYPAGRGEGALPGAQPLRQRRDEHGRDGPPCLGARRLDRDGLERALPADPAGRRREEVPPQPFRVEARRVHVDGVGGEIFGQPCRGGLDALREAEAERQLLVVPRRSHRHRQRPPVDPDLERLLDREGVGAIDDCAVVNARHRSPLSQRVEAGPLA